MTDEQRGSVAGVAIGPDLMQCPTCGATGLPGQLEDHDCADFTDAPEERDEHAAAKQLILTRLADDGETTLAELTRTTAYSTQTLLAALEALQAEGAVETRTTYQLADDGAEVIE